LTSPPRTLFHHNEHFERLLKSVISLKGQARLFAAEALARSTIVQQLAAQFTWATAAQTVQIMAACPPTSALDFLAALLDQEFLFVDASEQRVRPRHVILIFL
jgi:hypothetical protein